MIIKYESSSKCFLSPFDLIGNDEVALSKSFAFMLANSPLALRIFINSILPKLIQEKSFKNFQIFVEENYNNIKNGRTDIEIKSDDIHIIVECKIGNNQVNEQFTQYIERFKDLDEIGESKNESKNKIMCFITQDRLSQIISKNGIKYKYFSWLEIYNIYEIKKSNDEYIRNFLNFWQRRYEVNYIKEILIQDLGLYKIGLKRYFLYNTYKRDKTMGIPLYFSPHITKIGIKNLISIPKLKSVFGSIDSPGIWTISKVIKVLTFDPSEKEQLSIAKEDLGGEIKRLKNEIKDCDNLLTKWINGLTKIKEKGESTYYFLEDPIFLKKPLTKNKDKGWIDLIINKNRNVKFNDFIYQLNKLS